MDTYSGKHQIMQGLITDIREIEFAEILRYQLLGLSKARMSITRNMCIARQALIFGIETNSTKTRFHHMHATEGVSLM